MKRKSLKKALYRERREILEFREDLLSMGRCIFPSMQDSKTALHELYFLGADESHANPTARAGDGLLRHKSSQQLGKGTLLRVECSAKSTKVS